MQQAMAQLASHLTLRFTRHNGPAAGFEGMADYLAQGAMASLLVSRELSAQVQDLVGDHLAGEQRLVAGDGAALAEVRQELTASPVPGPFLELKAQAVQLFVEKSLGIDIARKGPTAFAVEQHGRSLVVVEDAACRAAAGDPGDVVGIEQQQTLALSFLQQRGNADLLGLDVRTAIRRGRQVDFLCCVGAGEGDWEVA